MLLHKMDVPTVHTKHVLDYLVGESRREMTLSIFQVILYILGVGIMVLVLYLLVKKILPVTNSVLPLVSTQLIPAIHSAEPVITDVTETIHKSTHKPSEQLSKIIHDIVWESSTTGNPTTNIGKTVKRIELLVTAVSAICSNLGIKSCGNINI